MSTFYYGGASHHHHSMNAPHSSHGGSGNANNNGHHHHHGGRSRRAPRLSSLHHTNKQFRPNRPPKEIPEPPSVTAFRRDFEAARSFELEDDELFCPFHLLTEDDLQSIHSSASDRSSLSSGSPQSSPLQQQLQPTPNIVYPPASSTYGPSSIYQTSSVSQPKLHQPLAQRTRNAIPIVDPTTGAVASPPPSVSPGKQMHQQFVPRRW